MDMSTRPTPPPEAALLKAGLKRTRTTARAAATQAGISEARWRQIVSGYQSVGGQQVPVRAPAETLARMAQAAGVTPDELRTAGRDDAAAELDALRDQPAGGLQPSTPTIGALANLLATLPPEAQDEVLRLIGRDVPGRPARDTAEDDHRQAI